VPRLNIGIALGGLARPGHRRLAARLDGTALSAQPFRRMVLDRIRNWDSNAVLLYRAKFYPGIQAFAYAELAFR